MANNPVFKDDTILNESSYLNSLKEANIDMIIEKKLAALQESEGGSEVDLQESPIDLVRYFGKTGIVMNNDLFALSAAVATAYMLRAAYRFAKEHATKAGRKCKHIKNGTPEKSACLIAAKIEEHKAHLAALKRMEGHCSKTKDPSKCKQKIKEKVIKAQAKIKKWEGKRDLKKK